MGEDRAAWRRFFVDVTDDGRATLRDTTAVAIESLRVSVDAPRSATTPRQLHDALWSTPICPDEGRDPADVFDELGRTVWAHGVRPAHPACVAHLHPPATVAAAVSDLLIGAANQSMDSWDQAPAATEVELHLLAWLASQIGFPSTGSGVMTSGGTASNVLGLTLARSWAAHRLGVDVLRDGLPPDAATWRILCADQAHFSVERAAAQLGLGRDAVVRVATDDDGAMDLDALDATLARLGDDGLTVIAIVATAGTTDLGAIDPIDAVAERAARVGAWCHVDAAVAGSFLLSPRLRARLAGIERADSVTIDFHKLWWQSFNASALVVRDVGRFDLLRVRSSYLDRGDELEGMINLVGRSLDTSRRFDAAKVVASLRVIGQRDFAAMVEYLVDVTTYAAQRLDAHPAFALVASPAAVMCVFDAPGASADDLRQVQQHLLARGEIILGRTTIKGRAALKFTFMNPLIERADVDHLIDTVAATLQSLRA